MLTGLLSVLDGINNCMSLLTKSYPYCKLPPLTRALEFMISGLGHTPQNSMLSFSDMQYLSPIFINSFM